MGRSPIFLQSFNLFFFDEFFILVSQQGFYFLWGKRVSSAKLKEGLIHLHMWDKLDLCCFGGLI